MTFRHLDAPHFCATRLEAFASRGEGDFYHHDLEDFLAIVDGRATLVAEIAAAPKDLRDFISETVEDLLTLQAFRDCLSGHLEGDEASQARLPLLVRTLKQIADIRGHAKRVSPPLTLIERSVENTVPRAATPSFRGGVSASRIAPWVSPQGRVSLRSSNLAAVEFDHASGVLIVEFHSGSIYRYMGVAPGVYEGLLRAYSHGR